MSENERRVTAKMASAEGTTRMREPESLYSGEYDWESCSYSLCREKKMQYRICVFRFALVKVTSVVNRKAM